MIFTKRGRADSAANW